MKLAPGLCARAPAIAAGSVQGAGRERAGVSSRGRIDRRLVDAGQFVHEAGASTKRAPTWQLPDELARIGRALRSNEEVIVATAESLLRLVLLKDSSKKDAANRGENAALNLLRSGCTSSCV